MGGIAESARVWRLADWPGVELFRATYVEHQFGRHAHATLAIGVVDGGTGEFWCQGSTHRAPRDHLVLINPGDAHTGRSRGDAEPLRYRMLYIDDDAQAMLAEGRGGPHRLRPGAPRDVEIAALVRQLHECSEAPALALRRETLLSELLQRLASRYGAGVTARPRGAGREPWAVARVREYLHAHLADNVSLRTLAELVALHPAYLNRTFCQAVGLPPHAYLVHLRVERARELLAAGATVAAVALAAGFTDQSHLTRHFKRALGVTPARFRAQLRGVDG